jgi:hypothetical protein
MTFSTWRDIFLMGAGVYAIGGLVYIPFIKAEPQPWNFKKGEEKGDNPEMTDCMELRGSKEAPL